MTDTKAAPSGMSERIVRAAYECFDRFGISKTTIEDIATRAHVSRPSVYKYFSGKDDIIDRICHDEAMKVNAEVRHRLVRTDKFDSMVTEAILVVIRVASENPYIRRTLEDAEYQANAIESTSTVHRIHRELWRRFLEHAMATGELASDIDIDDIITWLNMSQGMLLMRLGIVEQTDDQLRTFIRRFVVDPLLSNRYPRAEPAAEGEPIQKRRRIRNAA
jgi:AcrR family transcriptional regulator